MAGMRAGPTQWVPAWAAALGLIALALLPRLALHWWLVADYREPFLWEAEVVARALVEQGTLAFDWFGRTEPRPTAFLPPIYPLVVAAAMRVGGDDYHATLRIWQIALSTASALLVVPLAREITGSRVAAWTAGALAAVYPTFVAATAQVATVTLEVFWIEAFVFSLLRWSRGQRWAWLGLAGLSLGLLTLTRGPAALLWPIVALWLLFLRGGGDLNRRLGWLALFTASVALPIAPWTARNYLVIGTPVIIATNAGYNFWVGHNPAADGEFDSTGEANQPLIDSVAALSEPERDAFYMREGLRYLVSEPAAEARLSLRKLWYFLWFRPSFGSALEGDQRLREDGQLALMAGYGGVLPAAVIGMWLSRREWRRLFVVYGIWVAYAVSAVAFFAATRYRAPVEPFLIVFAALTVARVGEVVWRGRAGLDRRRGRELRPDLRVR